MVKAPARTGIDRSSKNEVIKIDHANKGASKNLTYLMCKNVAIKLIAPINEDSPAKCNAPIKKSTDAPGLYVSVDSGGYSVHPVAGPGIS
jgi:hypothetical protein